MLKTTGLHRLFWKQDAHAGVQRELCSTASASLAFAAGRSETEKAEVEGERSQRTNSPRTSGSTAYGGVGTSGGTPSPFECGSAKGAAPRRGSVGGTGCPTWGHAGDGSRGGRRRHSRSSCPRGTGTAGLLARNVIYDSLHPCVQAGSGQESQYLNSPFFQHHQYQEFSELQLLHPRMARRAVQLQKGHLAKLCSVSLA